MRIEDIKVDTAIVCETQQEQDEVCSILSNRGILNCCTKHDHFFPVIIYWVSDNRFSNYHSWQRNEYPNIPASDFISANTIQLDHTFELQAKIEAENK